MKTIKYINRADAVNMRKLLDKAIGYPIVGRQLGGGIYPPEVHVTTSYSRVMRDPQGGYHLPCELDPVVLFASEDLPKRLTKQMQRDHLRAAMDTASNVEINEDWVDDDE